MDWQSHLFKNFPQFVVIHTVNGFSVVNEAEADVLLDFHCFLYDPTDVGSLIPGFSAVSKPNLWSQTFFILRVCVLRHVQLFATPWTVACQAPLLMGLPRQERSRGLPLPPPWELLDSGIKPTSPALGGGWVCFFPPLCHLGSPCLSITFQPPWPLY